MNDILGFHSLEVKIEAEIEARTSMGCVANFHDIVKDFEAKIAAKLAAPIDGQASMAGPDTVASLYLVVTSDIAIVILDKIFTIKLDQPSSQSLGVQSGRTPNIQNRSSEGHAGLLKGKKFTWPSKISCHNRPR